MCATRTHFSSLQIFQSTVNCHRRVLEKDFTLNIHGKTPERTFLRLATVLVMLVAWVSNFFGLFTQYFNCKISVWSELLKNRPVLAFRFYKTILEIEQISISTLFRLVKDILMTCNIKLSILLKFQWDWPWKFK